MITLGKVIFKEASLVTLCSSSPVSLTMYNSNLSKSPTKGVNIITLLILKNCMSCCYLLLPYDVQDQQNYLKILNKI